jgi:hypothetical protein
MSGKNNVNPDHYKIAGRDRPNEVLAGEPRVPDAYGAPGKGRSARNFIPGALPVGEAPVRRPRVSAARTGTGSTTATRTPATPAGRTARTTARKKKSAAKRTRKSTAGRTKGTPARATGASRKKTAASRRTTTVRRRAV